MLPGVMVYKNTTMTWNPEIETGEVGEEVFLHNHNTCNGFAWDYVDRNENAVVKVSQINGEFHCYVYDSDLDVTIDETLGQFDGCPSAGIWPGDRHPYVDMGWDGEPWLEEEWEDKSAFTEHYRPDDDLYENGPFYL